MMEGTDKCGKTEQRTGAGDSQKEQTNGPGRPGETKEAIRGPGPASSIVYGSQLWLCGDLPGQHSLPYAGVPRQGLP